LNWQSQFKNDLGKGFARAGFVTLMLIPTVAFGLGFLACYLTR